ncbi:MAG: rod shape-determining protein MreC [Clostridiales bacterium]|nr:rod shape-determining protein MreC [Clostridiales bacterium]
MRDFNIKVVITMVVITFILVIQGLYARDILGLDFLQRPLSYIVYPFGKLFTYTKVEVNNTRKYFKDVDELSKENEKLKRKVDDLEKYISKILWLDEKNQELRETLELRDSIKGYDFIGASIIAKDAGNWFEIFTVDKGSKDGIYKDSFVIFEKGLVGRVYRVRENTCDIISILDKSSAVGARLTKTRELVLAKGDIRLKNRGLCKLEYIHSDAKIEVGDVVETSGLGEYFPKGIEIGKVREVVNPNDKLERYAIIEPSVDLKRIEEVLVAVKR